MMTCMKCGKEWEAGERCPECAPIPSPLIGVDTPSEWEVIVGDIASDTDMLPEQWKLLDGYVRRLGAQLAEERAKSEALNTALAEQMKAQGQPESARKVSELSIRNEILVKNATALRKALERIAVNLEANYHHPTGDKSWVGYLARDARSALLRSEPKSEAVQREMLRDALLRSSPACAGCTERVEAAIGEPVAPCPTATSPRFSMPTGLRARTEAALREVGE